MGGQSTNEERWLVIRGPRPDNEVPGGWAHNGHIYQGISPDEAHRYTTHCDRLPPGRLPDPNVEREHPGFPGPLVEIPVKVGEPAVLEDTGAGFPETAFRTGAVTGEFVGGVDLAKPGQDRTVITLEYRGARAYVRESDGFIVDLETGGDYKTESAWKRAVTMALNRGA